MSSGLAALGGVGFAVLGRSRQNAVYNRYHVQPYPSDQARHHFAGFFEFGFDYGAIPGASAAYIFEKGEAPINTNWGDVALGKMAAIFGSKFADGQVSPAQFGTLIATLCKP